MMFSDTIFDNRKVVQQSRAFQYIQILYPLNFYTDETIKIYESLNRLLNEGSMRDINME